MKLSELADKKKKIKFLANDYQQKLQRKYDLDLLVYSMKNNYIINEYHQSISDQNLIEVYCEIIRNLENSQQANSILVDLLFRLEDQSQYRPSLQISKFFIELVKIYPDIYQLELNTNPTTKLWVLVNEKNRNSIFQLISNEIVKLTSYQSTIDYFKLRDSVKILKPFLTIEIIKANTNRNDYLNIKLGIFLLCFLDELSSQLFKDIENYISENVRNLGSYDNQIPQDTFTWILDFYSKTGKRGDVINSAGQKMMATFLFYTYLRDFSRDRNKDEFRNEFKQFIDYIIINSEYESLIENIIAKYIEYSLDGSPITNESSATLDDMLSLIESTKLASSTKDRLKRKLILKRESQSSDNQRENNKNPENLIKSIQYISNMVGELHSKYENDESMKQYVFEQLRHILGGIEDVIVLDYPKAQGRNTFSYFTQIIEPLKNIFSVLSKDDSLISNIKKYFPFDIGENGISRSPILLSILFLNYADLTFQQEKNLKKFIDEGSDALFRNTAEPKTKFSKIQIFIQNLELWNKQNSIRISEITQNLFNESAVIKQLFESDNIVESTKIIERSSTLTGNKELLDNIISRIVKRNLKFLNNDDQMSNDSKTVNIGQLELIENFLNALEKKGFSIEYINKLKVDVLKSISRFAKNSNNKYQSLVTRDRNGNRERERLRNAIERISEGKSLNFSETIVKNRKEVIEEKVVKDINFYQQKQNEYPVYGFVNAIRKANDHGEQDSATQMGKDGKLYISVHDGISQATEGRKFANRATYMFMKFIDLGLTFREATELSSSLYSQTFDEHVNATDENHNIIEHRPGTPKKLRGNIFANDSNLEIFPSQSNGGYKMNFEVSSDAGIVVVEPNGHIRICKEEKNSYYLSPTYSDVVNNGVHSRNEFPNSKFFDGNRNNSPVTNNQLVNGKETYIPKGSTVFVFTDGVHKGAYGKDAWNLILDYKKNPSPGTLNSIIGKLKNLVSEKGNDDTTIIGAYLP